jgi:2'-5' RNA ligase
MDEKPVRAFIAVDLPDSLKREAGDLVASLKRAGADVKWTPPGNLHLTLKFLGDIMPAQTALIRERLASVAARQRSFAVHFAGLGGFPDLEHPRVIWAGVDEGERELADLAADLEAEMGALGFAKEARGFSAHLTLGRVKSGRNLGALAQEMKRISYRSSEKPQIAHLTLYKSLLSREGSVYEPVAKFPFIG